jgi:hypothetical protein
MNERMRSDELQVVTAAEILMRLGANDAEIASELRSRFRVSTIDAIAAVSAAHVLKGRVSRPTPWRSRSSDG